ncbi:putative membrane protein [Streptomyces sp. PvR018]
MGTGTMIGIAVTMVAIAALAAVVVKRLGARGR